MTTVASLYTERRNGTRSEEEIADSEGDWMIEHSSKDAVLTVNNEYDRRTLRILDRGSVGSDGTQVSWQAATEYSRARSPLSPVFRTNRGTRRICRPVVLRCCCSAPRATKRYRPNGSRCYPSLASFTGRSPLPVGRSSRSLGPRFLTFPSLGAPHSRALSSAQQRKC